ncbi:MAG: DUF1404 domain-containing protein [Metallosphaera sp.]
MKLKSKIFFLSSSFVIIVLTVNPYTLSLLPRDPVVLMVSHYTLYLAGVIAGYSLFRFSKLFVIPAVIPPIIFHLPYFFVESGINLGWTFIDYLSMVVGGVLLGGALRKAGTFTKALLFVLYMVGDTTLAVLLILGFPVYSPPVIQFSPYTPDQLVIVSYVMFGVMNVILFVVVGYTLRKLLS